MISDAVKKLVLELDMNLSEAELGQPFLSSHNYTVYPFDGAYFKQIRIVKSTRNISFVDGGNQELVGAPNFSIQYCRVSFNIFRGGAQRILPAILPQKVEFLSSTKATFKGEQIYFETKLVPILEAHRDLLPISSDLSFNTSDRRLMVGTARADIRRVASVARRFAEWKIAEHVVSKELSEGDAIIMDGTLKEAFPKEGEYAKAAYAASLDRSVGFCGLSKTSRTFTTSGLSLLGAVRKLALDCHAGPIWYYYPIAKSNSIERSGSIFILKLNDQSQRTFRFEIYAKQADELLENGQANEIFSNLTRNSTDFALPGYPYGLIDADDNARVRFDEVEPYRVLILSEISKLGSVDKFVRQIESSDAHDLLNSIRAVSFA